MRRIALALALAAALPAALPAVASELQCRMTRACVMGGPCLKADLPIVVRDAEGHSPRLVVDHHAHPADRVRNFYGTVYHGYNEAELGPNHPGELFVRPNGRTTYIRRADVRGVVIRTDYRGRCRLIADPALPPAIK